MALAGEKNVETGSLEASWEEYGPGSGIPETDLFFSDLLVEEMFVPH